MFALEDLKREAARLFGVDLTPGQIEAFRWYGGELVAWNRRFNLTAISDPTGIEVRHFLDSISCVRVMRRPGRPNPAGRLIDVGTGAGFPGIPLKIAFPDLTLTLVESAGKKADFCAHVTEGLSLSGVRLLRSRAEVVGRDPAHRQAYDWAVARAVAALPTLAEYLIPLLKIGGRAIAQKGESGPAEAQAAEAALRILGGRLEQVIALELPGVAERRNLVLMEKVAATPAKYPRRPGIPGKRPLK